MPFKEAGAIRFCAAGAASCSILPLPIGNRGWCQIPVRLRYRAPRKVEQADVQGTKTCLINCFTDGPEVGRVVAVEICPPVAREADVFELHNGPALNKR